MADLHRRKDEFLAMLSHELRNPLAPILNAVHLLSLQRDESPIQHQARTIIERQVAQLGHLVDDLLDISRVTTGKIRLHEEDTDLRSIVERAIEATRPLIEQRKHELTVSLPPNPIWLRADATRGFTYKPWESDSNYL
ncbi:MAG TPA: HAMP domain-containing sensor histidine kinase [Pyrinomonadaceae bacterium]